MTTTAPDTQTLTETQTSARTVPYRGRGLPAEHGPAKAPPFHIGPNACHAAQYADGAIVPDRRCTPGAVDSAAATNPQGTICVRGYAARVRPRLSYSERLKKESYIDYGATGPLSEYEEDHLVALEDGGSPRDPRNLWVEPLYGWGGAQTKDLVENMLHRRICAGRMTVRQAAAVLEGDWLRLGAGESP